MLMVHHWFSESFLSNDARGIQFGGIKQGVSSASGLLVYNWNEHLVPANMYSKWCASPSTTADALTKLNGCRAKTNKIQLLCFQFFHDSYCSGFCRDYLHIWLWDYSCLIKEAISTSLGDLFDFLGVEAPTGCFLWHSALYNERGQRTEILLHSGLRTLVVHI